jgi:hypothetical protein
VWTLSDLLSKSLQTSRTELEAGLRDAETELAMLRERCHQIEELIAVGKATLSAAQVKPSQASTKPSADIRLDDSPSLRAANSQK